VVDQVTNTRKVSKKEGSKVDSPAIATLIKMMETLPEAEQNQVVETVRSYIANLQDEAHWDQLFGQTQE
jgi:hypothetical protein